MAIRRKSRPTVKPNLLPRVDKNLFIRAAEMRVINEEGENLGVLKKQEALDLATEKGLDLVLINPQSVPPVAKIISWSKFKYDLSKKKKAQKGKTSEVKGMWIKPFIEEGDLTHKLGHVKEFLLKGDRVKLEIRPAKGRRADKDKMEDTAKKVLARIEEFGEVEGGLNREGRNISIFIKPKK
jgi:translation initiation factor IF-3